MCLGKLVYGFDRCLRNIGLEEMTSRDVVDKLEVAGLASGLLSST